MKLEVQKYLQENDLPSLCKKFAIKSSRHSQFPNLVLLKYDQINSPMAEPIVQECRGLILDENREWETICVSFFKFFNIGEVNATSIDWETARVYEKLDGSLMSIYFYDGEWRVASSGTPDAGGSMGNTKLTMAQSFWQTWQELGYDLPDASHQGSTFMFEFMTPWNRIIVQHEKPRVVLIGYRNHNLQESPPEEFAHFGWEVVKSFPLNTVEGVMEAVQTLKPLQNEGYVVCDGNFNRIKVKSPAYVALHHLRDSFSRRRLVEIVQKGESEEFLAYFPAFEPEYRDIKQRFDLLVEATETAWKALPEFARHQQKEFAFAIKGMPYAAVFFTLRAGKTPSPKAFYEAMPPERLLQILEAQ